MHLTEHTKKDKTHIVQETEHTMQQRRLSWHVCNQAECNVGVQSVALCHAIQSMELLQ